MIVAVIAFFCVQSSNALILLRSSIMTFLGFVVQI